MRLRIMVLIVFITYGSMLVPSGWSHSSSTDTPSSDTQQQETLSGAGMGAASAVATILYFPFKAAFAIAGGLVGGLAYVYSGFSEPTAKSVWLSSIGGTYVITPEHLTGDRPVRFLGDAAESEGMSNTSTTIND